MTFAAPAMLAGLLLPAVALVAYVVFQRMRRRYASRSAAAAPAKSFSVNPPSECVE